MTHHIQPGPESRNSAPAITADSHKKRLPEDGQVSDRQRPHTTADRRRLSYRHTDTGQYGAAVPVLREPEQQLREVRIAPERFG